MSRDLPPVAVLGATGHTGRFVVAELLARGLRPILAGRSMKRLEEVTTSGPVQARRVVDRPIRPRSTPRWPVRGS